MDGPSPKRLTRRDIRQPDRFMNLAGRLVGFVARKRNLVAGIIAGILVIFFSLWGWTLYQQRENRVTQEKYFQALELYRGGKHREAVAALTPVAAGRRSVYGRLALLHQAHSYVALGEYPKAVEVLREFLRRETKDPLLRQTALVNLGYVQEMSGQCTEALGAYVEAQKLAGPLKDEAILGQARCSAQTGKQKMALDSYRQYLSANPGSERNGEISVRVQELEAGLAQAGSQK